MIEKMFAPALAAGVFLAGMQSAPTTQVTAPPSADATIPIKTIVQIEITQDLSSKTNQIGDMFSIKLAAPLMIGERTVLPAGLIGQGQITHAAKRGGGGKAGELIVNARYLQCGDLRIPLGHLHLVMNGQSNVGAAFATSQFIPFGQFLVSGKDAIIPAGATGTAQINADTAVPTDGCGLPKN